MQVLTDPEQVASVRHAEVRLLAQRRFAMLEEDEPFDPNAMGYFLVVEPGDSVARLNERLGFDLLANRYTSARFDTPDFTPSFEVLEKHRTCYEIVFVLSDDGYGVEVFVPKEEGIDQELLAMCAMHAVPSSEAHEP
ncbi:hypothetical protein JI739_18690 [Ramlibacter sp. AW1]|uniref:Uncharacterized protein n=1 Tax=Ramlibacter aurantiacus TaxID=2801330 RepID=A0A936ZLH0_9BURK|nr:hypothetical protein [Ramlibacter aurantiacus]MBL0422383.1 hypothetical protein [Ramlibacter aurantiacus]